MKKPTFFDLKDYLFVGASILLLGSLMALPFTIIISAIAHDGMSLLTLIFLVAVDFSVRAIAMGYVTYYLYIGDEN